MSDEKEIYPYNFDTYLNIRIVFDLAPNSQSQNYWQCMENRAEIEFVHITTSPFLPWYANLKTGYYR